MRVDGSDSLASRSAAAPHRSLRPGVLDDRARVVFDGVCVLCSAFARFILERDRTSAFRLATAQSALGKTPYGHYELDQRSRGCDRRSACVAANRYRLFGRRKRCMIPPPEWRERFLG